MFKSSRTKVLMLLDEILWLIPKCQSKRSHRDGQTGTLISILCWEGKGGVWYKLPVDTREPESSSLSGQVSWLGGALLLWL